MKAINFILGSTLVINILFVLFVVPSMQNNPNILFLVFGLAFLSGFMLCIVNLGFDYSDIRDSGLNEHNYDAEPVHIGFKREDADSVSDEAKRRRRSFSRRCPFCGAYNQNDPYCNECGGGLDSY